MITLLSVTTKTEFNIRIRSSDSEGLPVEKSFTLRFGTIINNSPTGITLDKNTITENEPISTVIGTLSATDPDEGDTHTFTLTDPAQHPDNAAFTIEGNQLKSAASFDFETKASYTLNLEVSDAGGLTFAKVVTIEVTDANEAPTDLTLDNHTITENEPAGTLVGKFSSTDSDSHSSVYNPDMEALTWEEMAPVSVARRAYDGVEVLNGKIYFVGGLASEEKKKIVESYDPSTNEWETLTPLLTERHAHSAAILNEKLYAIGGSNLSSVEIFDPHTGQWATGPALPSQVHAAKAITINGKIYLIGGADYNQGNLNQLLELDPATNQWTQKTSMPTARQGHTVVLLTTRFGQSEDGRAPNCAQWKSMTSHLIRGPQDLPSLKNAVGRLHGWLMGRFT